MSAIYRLELEIGKVAKGPSLSMTFAWQEERKAFSVWFRKGNPCESEVLIVMTGEKTPPGFDLHSTVIMPDGFHAVHLLRKL
jgi:hypothetical protein